MKKVVVDWSTLPDELLELIARQLHFLEDYIRFGVVCKSWCLATLEKGAHLCSALPWLMLTEQQTTNVRRFHSPFSNKIYRLYLPEIHGRRCWGSSHGWLVTVGTDLDVRLINPLSRVQVSLPPLHNCPNLRKLICTPEEYRDVFVYKAALSASPLSSDCVVMAIYCDYAKMAFAKPGDDAWTPLKCSFGQFDDIIYFNGNFCAIESSGDVLIYDSTGSHVKTIAFTQLHGEDVLEYCTGYLVEFGGMIYVVLRCYYDTTTFDTPHLRTWGFIVYKLDICNEKWEEVSSLGNWSIFLGTNHSFAITTYDYPECRKNCIYFSDDSSRLDFRTPSSYDMGIYSLENHKIEPYLDENVSQFAFSLPLWIKPSLQ